MQRHRLKNKKQLRLFSLRRAMPQNVIFRMFRGKEIPGHEVEGRFEDSD